MALTMASKPFSIHREDTKKLMHRDIVAYKALQDKLRDALRVALTSDEYPDSMLHSALHSALVYGWKMPDGKWHPAPDRNSSLIQLGDDLDGDKAEG